MKQLLSPVLIALLCIASLAGAPVQAQDAQSDFKRINDAYAKLQSTSAKVTYRLYESGQSVPVQTTVGEMSFAQDYRYYHIDGIEIIYEGAHKNLYVNHDAQVIYYNGKVGRDPATPEPDIAAALKVCDRVEREDLGAKGIRYTLSFHSAPVEFNTIVLTISADNNLISELEVRYNTVTETYPADGPQITRLRMTYAYNQAGLEKPRRISDYLSLQDKTTASLHSTYQTYRFINQKN